MTEADSKELNLIRECEVCGSPAPDHLHFGGKRVVVVRPVRGVCCRAVLLLLSGLLQTDRQTGGEEGTEEVQGGDG